MNFDGVRYGELGFLLVIFFLSRGVVGLSFWCLFCCLKCFSLSGTLAKSFIQRNQLLHSIFRASFPTFWLWAATTEAIYDVKQPFRYFSHFWVSLSTVLPPLSQRGGRSPCVRVRSRHRQAFGARVGN